VRRFRFSRRALAELNEIVAYIAEDSPPAGLRVRESIFSACEKLGRQPGMGHRREDITRDDVRFWNVRGRFLIVYREVAGPVPVQIVRIFRAGRDVKAALS
jgi:plasmid stabilization system protein ParE